MKKYDVLISRTGYSSRRFEVEAENETEAEEKAMDMADDYEFREGDAEYNCESVLLLDEPDTDDNDEPDTRERYKGNEYFVDDNEYVEGINNGKMIFNWFNWERDGKEVPSIHPTQKPVKVLRKLIELFTDEGDVVIDPCAGSGSTLRAAVELGRNAYGFEIKKDFYREAKEQMLNINAPAYGLHEVAEDGTEQITMF